MTSAITPCVTRHERIGRTGWAALQFDLNYSTCFGMPFKHVIALVTPSACALLQSGARPDPKGDRLLGSEFTQLLCFPISVILSTHKNKTHPNKSRYIQRNEYFSVAITFFVEDLRCE